MTTLKTQSSSFFVSDEISDKLALEESKFIVSIEGREFAVIDFDTTGQMFAKTVNKQEAASIEAITIPIDKRDIFFLWSAIGKPLTINAGEARTIRHVRTNTSDGLAYLCTTTSCESEDDTNDDTYNHEQK